MNPKHAETLRFGKKREKHPPKNSSNAANHVLLCGMIAVGIFFFVTLTGGSLSDDAERVESAFRGDSLPVMSTAYGETLSADGTDTDDTVREFIRKNIRDASAEPFGYMNGRWNLWEYLGDVMAELLMGG
jgi:hypothetical protein